MKKTANSPYSYVVDLHDFQQRVIELSHQHPVLVDFWAEWCSPCLVLAPLLDQLLDEYEGEITLAKLEVDAGEGENMKLAGHYRVRGFPTVIVFVEGEEKGRFSGARPLPFLREFVEQHAFS